MIELPRVDFDELELVVGVNGKLHGYKREWNEQGRLISETLGELGIGVAEKRWDEQGRLIKDWHIGPQDSLYNTLQICRRNWGQSAPPL